MSWIFKSDLKSAEICPEGSVKAIWGISLSKLWDLGEVFFGINTNKGKPTDRIGAQWAVIDLLSTSDQKLK